MAARGQRFELDLDSPNWKFDVKDDEETLSHPFDAVSEIKERDSAAIPAAPTIKTSRTGFPEHRPRRFPSAFKQQQQVQKASNPAVQHPGPSDRAVLHHAAKKQGVNLAASKEKADIDAENRDRINNMSLGEIEEARAELMAQINPDALRRFLQRANVDDDHEQQKKKWNDHEAARPQDLSKKSVSFAEVSSKKAVEDEAQTDAERDEPSPERTPAPQPQPPPNTDVPSMHFPAPPRSRSDYKPLDPNSETFLSDLREHYFPDLPHDPNALAWLQDPTASENEESSYNPTRAGFAPSALRFSFTGTLIPPSEALTIPTSKGLHHHGDAPSSAGYTVPELTLLARSTLANQRCVAFQVMGRILYRLGRGDFGARGSELNEGLWTCIERERIIEVMMTEANKETGHLSARAFATEALWLWRRGGGGDRGVLKEGERRAT